MNNRQRQQLFRLHCFLRDKARETNWERYRAVVAREGALSGWTIRDGTLPNDMTYEDYLRAQQCWWEVIGVSGATQELLEVFLP